MAALVPGALVIMSHPCIDTQVVAEVQHFTKSMMTVLYYNRRGKSDEPRRRAISCIMGLLDPALTPEAAVELLATADSDRQRMRREAEEAYLKKVATVTLD